MNKRKILNDPVYGFITIPSDLIFDLIEHPYFQRLRRIKQVGLTHYVYPGALHTRFQHALGAMHLIGQAIHTLRMKGNDIAPEEEEAARIAILLHDTGHGPYSHALEELLLPYPHEELTLMFMHLLNKEFDGQLSLAIQIFEGSYKRRFFQELVSGQLDMDRMDYLNRDSFFTGVAEGVIGHDRIIAMLNVADDRIVVEEKGLFSIEKFLIARRLMYLQVYLHKAVISAEQMLRKVIVVLRQEISKGNTIELPEALHTFLSKQTADDWKNETEMLEAFAMIDDVDVDFTLKGLLTQDNKLLGLLSSGLLHRRLFKTFFSERAFPEAQVQDIIEQSARMLNLSMEDARETVITGLERVPMYDPGQGEIRIMRKDGTIVDVTELLPDHAKPGVHHRYYLCYPVVTS